MSSETDNSEYADAKDNFVTVDVDEILTRIESNLKSENENAFFDVTSDFKDIFQAFDADLPIKIFTWASKIANDNITTLLVKELEYRIGKYLNDNPWKLINLIPVPEIQGDNKHVVPILMKAVDSLADESFKKLLCDFVIPAMYQDSLGNEHVQDLIIDFGFELIKRFPITKFNPQEVKVIISKFMEQYIGAVEKGRQQEYKRWHELWIFAAKFFGTYLHGVMDFANKLLRIVECAFRNNKNSGSEQRLKGYECWKAMIDNSSLNMKYITGNKQIKLLVTPLKAKFSKQEAIICKRFEVFLYLLQKLQSNSVLCLNDFFEFCFGVSNTNYAPKTGLMRSSPKSCLQCIKVVLAILGDQTYMQSDQKLFSNAIIDENNIDRFNPAILYALVECSALMKIVSVDVFEKIKLLQCLWNALFDILKRTPKEVQEKIFGSICNSLDNLFKEYQEDFIYLSLLNVFSELAESDISNSVFNDALKNIIEHFINYLNEEVVMENLHQSFELTFSRISKNRITYEFLTDQLKKLEPIKNDSIVYKLWNALKVNTSEEDSKSVVVVLLWPIFHLHKSANIAKNVSTEWTELFSHISDSQRRLVINEIDKAFKSNPLLSSNISSILAVLAQSDLSLENGIDKSLLKLMANIVLLPLLSEETAEKLFPMISKCISAVSKNNEVDLESVENICQCLEKIPIHQKNSKLSESLENLLKMMGPDANTTAFRKLKNILSTFPSPKTHKKTPNSNSFTSPDGCTTPTSSLKRSIRMTQMVFDKDSTPNREKVDALQLFGKDIETRTPLKVKGSILQNAPTPTSSRSKKIINSLKKAPPPAPSIQDEQTCEFAVIDTEVKLRKDMLTEHQKEKMRERREDIPALYQDLSQSHSQSCLSTQSSLSTQSNQVTVLEKEDNEQQLIKFLEDESMEFQKLELSVEEKIPNRTIEILKHQDDNDSNTNSSDESDSKRKDKLAERELRKIKMDLVGGNSFIQNLPSKRPRKTIVTPKKSKKSETDKPTTTKEVKSNSTHESETNTAEEVVSKSIPEQHSEGHLDLQSTSSQNEKHIGNLTPNRRKSKMMKPIKNLQSPSSEKKKNKLEKKETGSARKAKEPKEKSKTKRKSLSDLATQSTEGDTVFESEVNQNTKGKTANGKQAKPTGKKTTKLNNPGNTSEEKTKEMNEAKGEVAKRKKTSKELMKRNKEKVKTIQSQLKLADLSNLEGSSEKSKPKNAKLIFIRELTNPKNSQNTKVSPAGLKRNKDNRSKNIAYTIETPDTSLNISSLVEINDMQPSCSKSNEAELGDEVAKPKKKRRRKYSEGSVSGDSESPDGEQKKKKKMRRKSIAADEAKTVENDEEKNTDVEREAESPKNVETLQDNEKEGDNTSSGSSLFSPDSPSGSTRSKTNSPKNENLSPQRQVSPKSVRTLFKDSEDIIESSQGSQLENSLMSIGNLSKTKLKQSLIANKEPEEPKDVEMSPKKSPKSGDSPNPKPVSQATTLTCESSYEAQPAVVQVELPEKQELSDSEKLLSMADTVSIESTLEDCSEKTGDDAVPEKTEKLDEVIDEDGGSPVPKEIQAGELGTPQKPSDNLPGSPVSVATPTYKQELIDNTSDISPIGTQAMDAEDVKTRDLIAALDAALGQQQEIEEPVTKLTEEVRPASVANERSNKLLNMVNVESPVSSQKGRRKLQNPGQNKTRKDKLFSFYACGGTVDEEGGKEARDEDQGDILTFSREVPSPLAVPGSSILKRKLADTDESFSPCPKRKRVNFSYPCITSTKLFIRHKDELNTHYRPTFSANLFTDDAEDEDMDDPFANPEAYQQNGTEESMDITNSLLLCSNKPIDERLINCEDSLTSLWKRLSSPAYCDRLKDLLRSKNIETVGDLASLKEVEINRLPFKEPKIKTVKKALSHYYNKIQNKSKEGKRHSSESSSTSSEDDKDTKLDLANGHGQNAEIDYEITEEKVEKPENLKDELRIVLAKIKQKETSLEEFGEVFIDLIEEADIINVLENVYNTNFRKFFGRSHWRYLIESIVKSGGTSELFDIISDLAEQNKVFADQLEHVVQVRIDQDPLRNILKKKTLVQVSAALQECITEGDFQRENVLQVCLMPLIKSPSDIRNYFNSLTIVQVHDLFIERVQPSDLTCFLDQIRDHYGNYTMAQCANRKDVLKICSKEELATSLIEKEGDVGAVKHLLSNINDQEKLLELYNYIGSLLPLKSRVQSHIDLLKSICFDKDPVE